MSSEANSQHNGIAGLVGSEAFEVWVAHGILNASTEERATWWGCGNHVPAVMSNIPEHEWCTCEPKVEKDGEKYPPKGEQPDS
ncbi:hypothetical protein HYE67_008125 [Fusarium culmorum]|uniref:Uncharacterized protein n=1 Tax=Fusarium culmorum TaxID=5516 RepID=A0A2T4H6C5_FUSCU|nr:hypothetical protein FCULG_00002801 [Fusarium culmorum]QPC65894.1 hypothetical protein HYE67_008125 [Fusarium culmorum]